MLGSIADWLAGTALSHQLQATPWAIPLLQSVHILAIAALMGAAWVVCLQVFGVLERVQPLPEISDRLLPWIHAAVVVLALTGGLLVVAEPKELLFSGVLQMKLLLLIGALAVTSMLHRKIRATAAYGNERTQSFSVLRGIAALSMLLWVIVAVAGRWIAYSDF
jgi:hypothetical protein